MKGTPRPMLAALVNAGPLALCGGLLIFLAVSPDYWLLLNPKFRPLTWAAGAGLLLAGAGLFAAGGGKANPVASVALTIFCVGAFLDRTTLTEFGEAAAPKPASPLEDDAQSRLRRGEVEYVKINLAEIFGLTDNDPAGVLKGPLAVRGLVKFGPKLDEAGLAALVRPVITCCLADAVALGVALPKNATLKAGLAEGGWALFYGRLAPFSPPPALANATLGAFQLRGIFTNSLHPRLKFEVEAIEAIPSPEMQFLYEARDREPFNF